jgi:hypothetical protein
MSGRDERGAMTVLRALDNNLPLAEGLPAPVFIHSSWRTASTWLWEKLRQAPTVIAYCEIFHERLADCTMPYLRENDFSRWNSKHPEGAPYFLEFAALIEGGAVRGYDPRMAVESFLPAGGLTGELSRAERVYLEGLIDNAFARRKIPVLTDTRTLGRAPAIARACPGRHVLLVRNIFHQWASYSEQWANGNRYFLEMQLQTIEASRGDPFVALIADWFHDGEASATNPATFQLFLLFHVYLYLRVFDSADLVVDIGRVATDAHARADAETALTTYVRWPIDLADARLPFGLSLFAARSKPAFVDVIEQFAKQMIDGSVSQQAADFAMRMKDEALAEWERCEFYAAGHRTWAGARLDALKRAGAESQAALMGERTTNARLAARVDRLKAARDKNARAKRTRPSRPRGEPK